MTLGTVDMIISGPSFAARSYPRLGIAYYPFIFRDADHLLAYSKSPVFAEMVEELPQEDRHPDHGVHLLRRAADDGAKAVHRLRRHEGPEDPRARRAGLHGDAEGLRRQPDADRLRRGLPRAAERHRRRAGESADDDRGEEVLRSAEGDHDDRPHRRRPDHAGRAARLEQADRRTRRRSSPRSRAKPPPARPRRSRSARPSSPTSSRRRACRSSQVDRKSFVDAVLKNAPLGVDGLHARPTTTRSSRSSSRERAAAARGRGAPRARATGMTERA